jgi:superfamily I DNA/RNA helicase
MAKEKWLINLNEMDEFQRQILDLSIDESYLIKGCAGSGKTILALRRAHDIKIRSIAEKKPVSFTLLVYTKALRSFIKSGVLELDLNLNQVQIYSAWDESPVDYIVVDEVQDFTKERIDTVHNAAMKSIMLYGDSQQQIYPETMTTDEIAEHLKLPQRELLRNYRLPKSIASFASYVVNDTELVNKCVKPGEHKPRLIKFNGWQQELDFIMKEIETRNYTDCAILLPFNNKQRAMKYVPRNVYRNVEFVKEYFDSKGFDHEYKLRDDDRDNWDIDFDSEYPKVLTCHSSKGLQFETVFIPFCDYPFHDNWFIEWFQNPFYVGLTRSYRHLYLTHSSEITPFLKGIPKVLHD